MTHPNPFGSKASLETRSGKFDIYKLSALNHLGSIERLPFSMRVLLESALRNVDGFSVREEDVEKIAKWRGGDTSEIEIPFKPSRVVLQDFTGVPAVVDLAALRSALAKMGGDPQKINPQVPVDLVIDHSVQVDSFGSAESRAINERYEFERNRERYEFLHWGQKAFENFSAVPPGTGIVHQVNLEYLATAVSVRDGAAFPDSLVGTDSHTTMINGLGVLGWGVGGIEAEAVMLGQPIYMLMPQVVGFRLTGSLREGTTATDLVLTVTQMLRAHGVVGKFVEFTGSGMKALSLADRATIANMAPEYGATMGFFPIDDANTLPMWLQETIASYVSMLNDCPYSLANHWANARHLIADEARADAIEAALRADAPERAFDGRELALMRYARKLTRKPGAMVEADVAELRNQGLDDGQILEANQIIGYFNYANRLLNGLGVTTEGDVVGYYAEQ